MSFKSQAEPMCLIVLLSTVSSLAVRHMMAAQQQEQALGPLFTLTLTVHHVTLSSGPKKHQFGHLQVFTSKVSPTGAKTHVCTTKNEGKCFNETFEITGFASRDALTIQLQSVGVMGDIVVLGEVCSGIQQLITQPLTFKEFSIPSGTIVLTATVEACNAAVASQALRGVVGTEAGDVLCSQSDQSAQAGDVPCPQSAQSAQAGDNLSPQPEVSQSAEAGDATVCDVHTVCDDVPCPQSMAVPNKFPEAQFVQIVTSWPWHHSLNLLKTEAMPMPGEGQANSFLSFGFDILLEDYPPGQRFAPDSHIFHVKLRESGKNIARDLYSVLWAKLLVHFA